MLKHIEKAPIRAIPVAQPHAPRVDAKAAVKLALERYPTIIARLAK